MALIIDIFDYEAGILTIRFPESYDTITWQNEFGAIENMFSSLNSTIRRCHFDLTNVAWAEPLPLLSLLILIKSEKVKSSSFEFFLIINDPGSKSGIDILHRRFVSFLFCEGYTKAFIGAGARILNQYYRPASLFTESGSLMGNLAFQDSLICEPRLIDINEVNSHPEVTGLANWIRSLQGAINHRLKRKIPMYHSRQVINTIYSFLTETLTNIEEHAYPIGAPKFAAFYIRYRNGLINSSVDKEQREILEAVYANEKETIPELDHTFAELTAGFIEIFVCDRGMGTIKSFKSNSKNQKPSYPLEHVIKAIIKTGERNKNETKKKHTQYGGLYILSKIIKKGFIWFRESNEFFGETLPSGPEAKETRATRIKYPPKGFSIIGRISWAESLDQRVNWKTWADTDIALLDHPLLKTLQQTKEIYQKYLGMPFKQLKSNPYYISDQRIRKLDPQIFRTRYLENTTSTNFILYLPPMGQRKNEIYDAVSNNFLGIANPSKVMLIADILETEAEIYEYAISGAKFNTTFLKAFDSIILVTRNLQVLYLDKYTANGLVTYQVNGNKALAYIKASSELFAPNESLEHLIEWLRAHDSMLFWRYIFKKNKSEIKDFFIYGSIEWSRGNGKDELETYFNFLQTLSDRTCNFIYDFWMEKLISLCRKVNELSVDSTDMLTRQLVDIFKSKKALNETKESPRIIINSVMVQGKNLPLTKSSNNNFSISFFVNRAISAGSDTSTFRHFILWPDQHLLSDFLLEHDDKVIAQRIGSSAFVATHGWKHYSVPRYFHQDYPKWPVQDAVSFIKKNGDTLDQSDFFSITAANPVETYEDWQSKSILSLGHFEHGNYHDIVKIDIPFAFDESFEIPSQLACFLIYEFALRLDVSINDLVNNEYYKEPLRNYANKRNLMPGNPLDRAAEVRSDYIFYTSHFATDHIMRKLLTVFPEYAKDRIISLLPLLPSSSTTPMLLSPQLMDRVKDKVAKRKSTLNKKIITATFFDSVRINGKTEKEIKHALNTCGIETIRSLIILDRSRLPIHIANSNDYQVYWKLDVPVLGGRKHCVICKSLSSLRNMIPVITNNILNERIDEVIRLWKPNFRYSPYIENHGLTPRDLNLTNKGLKKFGIYMQDDNTHQVGGDENLIAINDSHGLTVYCSELLSMTTRDDVLIAILNKEKLPYAVKVEAICTLILLHSTEMSVDTKFRLLEILFKETRMRTELDNYTGLVLITLIANKEVIQAQIYKWIQEDLSTIIRVDNNDILLFLIYVTLTNGNADLAERQEMKRLLMRYNKSELLIKEFHSELFNDNGQYHQTPLHKMVHSEEPTPYLIRDAYSSIKKLRFLLEETEVAILINLDLTEDIREDMMEIDAYAESLYNKIKVINKYNDQVFEQKISEIYLQVKPGMKYLYEKFAKFHKYLFIQLNIKASNTFLLRDELIKLSELEEFKKYTIGISKGFLRPKFDSSSIQEKYIPYNTKIKSIIKDIFSNCQHIQKKVKDRYNVQSTPHHVWISTDWDKTEYRYFKIIFFSKIGNDISEKANHEMHEKNRPINVYLNTIGGSQCYETEFDETLNTLLFKCVLTLPFM